MNERETIQTKLKQNDADQEKLREEHGRLETELVDLDKPKLRHGDYGYDADMEVIFIAENGRKDKPEAFWEDDGRSSIDLRDFINSFNKLGNIFDDLKRNQEDLREFKADVHTYKLDFKNCPHAPIYIAGNYHPMHEAIEIHQKLGQLIATAKRDQKKE